MLTGVSSNWSDEVGKSQKWLRPLIDHIVVRNDGNAQQHAAKHFRRALAISVIDVNEFQPILFEKSGCGDDISEVPKSAIWFILPAPDRVTLTHLLEQEQNRAFRRQQRISS